MDSKPQGDASPADSVRRDGRLIALLVGCLVASIAIYLAVAMVLGSVPSGYTSVVGFSLESGPLFRAMTGLPRLSFTPVGFSAALGALLTVGWLLWLIAVLAYPRLGPAEQALGRTLVIGGGCLMLVLVVVLVPPVLSADLYRQASYGQMVARWGLNPYAVRAADVPWNPLLRFANQTATTTIYGPAYTLVSALVSTMAPATPLGSALAWKTLSALAALGTALVAAPVARSLASHGSLEPGLRRPSSATLLLLWNPLLILESAGSAHVEALMMLPALAGMWLMLRKRDGTGAAILTISTLTKWTTGPLLALGVWHAVRKSAAGPRWRKLVRLLVTAGLTAVACYLPFATGLVGQGGIHELALHGGTSLGNPTRPWMPQWLAMSIFALLIVGAAWAGKQAGWGRQVALATVLMLVLVLVIVPWLFPWYLLAPMVLAAILPNDLRGKLLRLVCFGLGGGLMLYYAKLVALP